MSPQARREYVDAVRRRYRRSRRKIKTRILDELCAVCGYDRKYAIRLLNRPARAKPARRGPKRRYGPEVLAVIKGIWLAAEQPCSKRLKALVPLWLPFYERHYEPLDPETRRNVLQISPPTIDRLLKPVRARRKGRGLSATRTAHLRTQIPIRTNFWEVTGPGYFEADTVAHCGDSLAGKFVWSLTFTDIHTGWTENRAVWNRNARQIVTQIRDIEQRLVFNIQGFDCDNGGEFLNHQLYRYFHDRPVPVLFTRSRPYHRNDNAHVEQKQWTHVRQLLGYQRLEERRLVALINDLYRNEWWALQNFFLPTMKLLSKERIASRVKRYHTIPRTPCQRLLDSPDIDDGAKNQLRETLGRLDPFELKKAIEKKLRTIFNRVRKQRKRVSQPHRKP